MLNAAGFAAAAAIPKSRQVLRSINLKTMPGPGIHMRDSLRPRESDRLKVCQKTAGKKLTVADIAEKSLILADDSMRYHQKVIL